MNRSAVAMSCAFLLLACAEQEAGSSSSVSAGATVSEASPAPHDDDTVAQSRPDTTLICPQVVLDATPGLGIHATPDNESDVIGELQNGSEVRVVETQHGWAKVAESGGWVHLSKLYDSCNAPAVLPAMAMGAFTYLLLPGATVDGIPTDETRVPPAATDDEMRMSFSVGHSVLIDAPARVSLVTATSSCVRDVIRQVTLVGDCAGQRDGLLAQALTAFEVRSCDDFPALGQQERPIGRRVVGVFGEHPEARIGDLNMEPHEPSAAQVRALDARALLQRRHLADAAGVNAPEIEREQEGSGAAGTSFSFVRVGDETVVFHGDTRVARPTTALFPDGGVFEQGHLLALMGNAGFHGHGLFMIPNHARPGQLRTSWIHNYSCSTH